MEIYTNDLLWKEISHNHKWNIITRCFFINSSPTILFSTNEIYFSHDFHDFHGVHLIDLKMFTHIQSVERDNDRHGYVIKYCRDCNLVLYHTNDLFPALSIRRLSHRCPLCTHIHNVSTLIFLYLNESLCGRNFCMGVKTSVDNEYDNKFFFESTFRKRNWWNFQVRYITPIVSLASKQIVI